MSAPFRTTHGGRIDRNTVHTFTFNGRELTGHAGDTLASALLANGVHQVTTSIKLGRPRGFTSAWAEDTGGLVQIEYPFPEPMLLATTAPTPMVRPISAEVWKKRTTPASRTAAAIGCWPSRET